MRRRSANWIFSNRRVTVAETDRGLAPKKRGLPHMFMSIKRIDGIQRATVVLAP